MIKTCSKCGFKESDKSEFICKDCDESIFLIKYCKALEQSPNKLVKVIGFILHVSIAFFVISFICFVLVSSIYFLGKLLYIIFLPIFEYIGNM